MDKVTSGRRGGVVALIVAVAMLAGACGSGSSPTPGASQAQPSTAPASATPASSAAPSTQPTPVGSKDLILATTTSTQDSGLLDVLVPDFQAKTGYVVKTVAVGSGQALKMGEEGNADVLLVHSPAAEKTYMENGFGVDRRLVMHNFFIIVGPTADPAAIRGLTSATEAFKKIAAARATFVSRGDGSGTEAKELTFWKAAAITPEGSWYLKSGQGMAPTLKIASEKAGYTLADIATWAATKAQLSLEVLVQGDPALLNIYHVISVNPAKWPKVNAAGATAFADYLVSPETQALIGAFGVDTYGLQLFVPDAGKTDADLQKP